MVDQIFISKKSIQIYFPQMRLDTKYDTKKKRRLRLSHQQIKNKTKKQENKTNNQQHTLYFRHQVLLEEFFF